MLKASRYRIILLLLLGLVLHKRVGARQRAYGYCEQGAAVVTTASLTSTTQVQGSFPSCSITVYTAGTLNIAKVYSDNSGTVQTNPFTAGADGRWFFYADDGRYDVNLSGGGIGTPFTIGDVRLTDSYTSLAQYGCVGDNSTDNSTCLSNAFNAMSNTILYCGPGTYKFATAITVTGQNGGLFNGEGAANSGGCVLNYTGTGPGITFKKTRDTTWKDFTYIVTSGSGFDFEANINTVGDTIVSNKFVRVNLQGPGADVAGSYGYLFNMSGPCAPTCYGSNYFNLIDANKITGFETGIKTTGYANGQLIKNNTIGTKYGYWFESNESNVTGDFFYGGGSTTAKHIVLRTANSFYNNMVALSEDAGTCLTYDADALATDNFIQVVTNCGVANIDLNGGNTVWNRFTTLLKGNFTLTGTSTNQAATYKNIPTITVQDSNGNNKTQWNTDLTLGTLGVKALGAIQFFPNGTWTAGTQVFQIDSTNGLKALNAGTYSYPVSFFNGSTFQGQIYTETATNNLDFLGGANGSVANPTLQITGAGGNLKDSSGVTILSWGAGRVTINGTTQANLGSAVAARFVYCSDCVVGGASCAGGGTGAWAFANGSIWKCTF